MEDRGSGYRLRGGRVEHTAHGGGERGSGERLLEKQVAFREHTLTGPHRDNRSAAGPQNPPPPHQDRCGPTGAGRGFLRLNLFSRPLLRGSLRPLSQCPAPFEAHGRRLTPISGSPTLPPHSPFALSLLKMRSNLAALLLKASPSRRVSNVLPFGRAHPVGRHYAVGLLWQRDQELERSFHHKLRRRWIVVGKPFIAEQVS